MCGANLGDVFTDLLHLGPFLSLAIEALAFVVIVAVDRISRRGYEANYWLAILAVRSAATNIADHSIRGLHLTLPLAALGWTAMLALLVLLQFRGRLSKITRAPPTNIPYWLTMLTAGVLGTLLGDWGAHSQASVVVGVLTSVCLASLALTIVLAFRAKLSPSSVVMYWLAIVCVRWWGTNMGDILAHETTLYISLFATAFLLAAILSLWGSRKREGDISI